MKKKSLYDVDLVKPRIRTKRKPEPSSSSSTIALKKRVDIDTRNQGLQSSGSQEAIIATAFTSVREAIAFAEQSYPERETALDGIKREYMKLYTKCASGQRHQIAAVIGALEGLHERVTGLITLAQEEQRLVTALVQDISDRKIFLSVPQISESLMDRYCGDHAAIGPFWPSEMFELETVRGEHSHEIKTLTSKLYSECKNFHQQVNRDGVRQTDEVKYAYDCLVKTHERAVEKVERYRREYKFLAIRYVDDLIVEIRFLLSSGRANAVESECKLFADLDESALESLSYRSILWILKYREELVVRPVDGVGHQQVTVEDLEEIGIAEKLLSEFEERLEELGRTKRAMPIALREFQNEALAQVCQAIDDLLDVERNGEREEVIYRARKAKHLMRILVAKFKLLVDRADVEEERGGPRFSVDQMMEALEWDEEEVPDRVAEALTMYRTEAVPRYCSDFGVEPESLKHRGHWRVVLEYYLGR